MIMADNTPNFWADSDSYENPASKKADKSADIGFLDFYRIADSSNILKGLLQIKKML